MRSAIPLAGVLLVAGVAAVMVRGQPDRPANTKSPRTITANGTGTATGKPDTVRVYLGVNSFARSVDDARTANRDAVKRVREAVAKLNIPDTRTRTTDTQVSFRHANDDRLRVIGYDVSQTFTVRVSDADPEKLAVLAERILDAGLANGVNTQGRVEFFLADDTALRRQAMEKAVADAMAAAKAFATGAQVIVAEVTSIEDTPNHWYGAGQGFNNNVQAVGGVAEGGTLSAGNWTVTSSVKVVCRY